MADITDQEPSASGHETTARSFRSTAQTLREEAVEENLPNRKQMLLRSADVWDDRAKAIEDMLGKRRINEAAKQDAPTRRPGY